MLTQQQKYTAVANAILPVIQSDINNMVPSWARGMIPDGTASEFAGQCAKAAVDAYDALLAKQEQTS